MSLLDTARRAYLSGDRIIERMGLAVFRVGVLEEGSTEAFGVPDADRTQHVRWISPAPRVRKIDTLQAAHIGFSVGPGSNLDGQRDVYEVIIPRAAECTRPDGSTFVVGSRVADLFPTDGSPKSRTTIVIADARDDGELGREGVPFVIERMRTDEVVITLYVVQAQVMDEG